MKKTTRSKKVVTHPVPEWMDDDVKQMAAPLDVLQRHELAADLERKAEQLRDMKQRKPAVSETAQVPLRPTMVKALLAFYEQCAGDKDSALNLKLGLAVRWYLESSLPLIGAAWDNSVRQMRYLKAEGLDDVALAEAEIGRALEKWESSLESDREEYED